MKRRQSTIPTQWLITDERLGPDLLKRIRAMPRGSGVLVRQHQLRPRERQRLIRRIGQVARQRQLTVVDEAAGAVARVHGTREMRQAQLGRAELLFLSPLFPTRTHPEWRPLPRMRAAALARLSRLPLIALGGMDSRRFARVRRLGFSGWAGIDAWKAG